MPQKTHARREQPAQARFYSAECRIPRRLCVVLPLTFWLVNSFISARIPQPCCDTANGCGDGAVDLRCLFTGSFAAQQIYLNEVHWIDIRVAQPDRAG